MKKKFTPILLITALLVIIAAVWQAREAATLEERLLDIDRRTQTERLLAASLPEVRNELQAILQAECNKMGQHLPFEEANMTMPAGGKADFNRSFFLYAEGNIQTPAGEPELKDIVSDVIINNIPRQARFPHGPIVDPKNPATDAPTYGMTITTQDTKRPVGEKLRITGNDHPFFTWAYDGQLICMRPHDTNGGRVADGFVIDTKVLASHLIPILQKNGLRAPSIEPVKRGERGNLGSVPLRAIPGTDVDLPNSKERREALHGTIASAWAISILTVIILFGLLAFYTGIERRRSDFVSAVTHELRTPLTSFTLYTELLKSGNLTPEKETEYHDTLYNESRRLGHLVENVLAFAKLTRGKVRGRQDVGSCGKLLTDLFNKIKERLNKDKVAFHYSFDSRLQLLSLRTDLLSVEQILLNLADNAVKYADNEKPSITINVVQTHRMITIRFTDNGPGIPANVQKDLFRAFSRSAKAEQGRKPGVGLGLALSRDLARSIGGDLLLEHSSAKGSTFILQLPLGE